MIDIKVFLQVIDELEVKLGHLTVVNISLFTHFEQAIGLCNVIFHDIRNQVLKNTFNSNGEEITFFKIIKPRVVSKLIFFRRLARIESRRPKYTREDQVIYLKDEIRKLHDFYAEHSDFYEYYQTEQTYHDELYFTRNQTEIVLNNRNSDYLTDPDFSTIHDKTVATIIAYENLEKYLNNEIQKIQNQTDPFRLPLSNQELQKYNWSGSQVDYVELLYSITESGIINNGRPGIKELHEMFSEILNLPEIDIYEKLQDIKKRKKSKTVFLDKLKSALLRKLEDSDEFKP